MLLLEKTEFPREKVCGDGLTPRAVKQLIKMGIDTDRRSGWLRNKGLRVIGGGVRLELDWPDLASFPNYGLTRTRLDFDEILADTGGRGRRGAADRHTTSPARCSTTTAGSSGSTATGRTASRGSSARRW